MKKFKSLENSTNTKNALPQSKLKILFNQSKQTNPITDPGSG